MKCMTYCGRGDCVNAKCPRNLRRIDGKTENLGIARPFGIIVPMDCRNFKTGRR